MGRIDTRMSHHVDQQFANCPVEGDAPARVEIQLVFFGDPRNQAVALLEILRKRPYRCGEAFIVEPGWAELKAKRGDPRADRRQDAVQFPNLALAIRAAAVSRHQTATFSSSIA